MEQSQSVKNLAELNLSLLKIVCYLIFSITFDIPACVSVAVYSPKTTGVIFNAPECLLSQQYCMLFFI